MDDKKNVYITLHKNFVHEGIEYEDRKTGETKTFNSVTLPKGTVVNGQDVSYSQFSPLFVNPSRFKGENYRDERHDVCDDGASTMISVTRSSDGTIEAL